MTLKIKATTEFYGVINSTDSKKIKNYMKENKCSLTKAVLDLWNSNQLSINRSEMAITDFIKIKEVK